MCAFARTLLRLLGRVPIALALLAALVLARPAGAQADSGFTVIVNAVDPVAVLSRDEISRLFPRKIATWPYRAVRQAGPGGPDRLLARRCLAGEGSSGEV